MCNNGCGKIGRANTLYHTHNVCALVFCIFDSEEILLVWCLWIPNPFSTFEFWCMGQWNLPIMVFASIYFTLTIQKPYIWRCKWVFFEIRGVTLSYPDCPTLRIKKPSKNPLLKRLEQRRNYIWPSLSGPGFLQGDFLVTQVVVFIKSMTIFEAICEWNIVHELRCLGLTCDVGEKMCRHLLDWILYQTRVSRYYFHYTIRFKKIPMLMVV